MTYMPKIEYKKDAEEIIKENHLNSPQPTSVTFLSTEENL